MTTSHEQPYDTPSGAQASQALAASAAASSSAPVTPQQASLNCGVVGNCAFSALIDQQGQVVWSCLPRFDGDPVFNSLLDASENGSVWGIDIENYARSEQFYEPNTAVLRTRLYDTEGRGVEITDFAPRFLSRDRMFRFPWLLRATMRSPRFI